ncbi:hypothetical protein ACFUN8_33005 [Streptomyces sp. NPDC057307]|uniref:hypothetical protein n=1 Tax=Streptomyces sp. NPDC057307 TaxID=3346096 RepID=UPI003643750B
MDTYELVVFVISCTIVVLGIPWVIYEAIKESREERRRAPRTAEQVFIDMRIRKHDTMRRLRDVARDHRNK